MLGRASLVCNDAPPCGTRTRNLRIRRPTPCPLGQGGLRCACAWTCMLASQRMAHPHYDVSNRQRGGIEPLHISMPLELKSSPSTNPTHPGSHYIILCAQPLITLVHACRPCCARIITLHRGAAARFTTGSSFWHSPLRATHTRNSLWCTIDKVRIMA